MEDNVPHGSRFLFTIMARIEEKKVYPTIEDFQLVRNSVDDILKNRKINVLVVEDDKPSMSVLEIIIKDRNNNIIAIPAVDGQRGFEVYKKEKIDMIITDIQMPNMDGLSMIQQIRLIRTKEQDKHMPIWSMTAFTNVRR